jgi:hypothetical protein
MPTMEEDVQLPSSSFAGAASMNKLKAAMEGERKFSIAARVSFSRMIVIGFF